MKGKKRVDTRPLDQRVKKIPYVIDQDGKKRNLTQKIKIPKKIRFPDNDESITVEVSTDNVHYVEIGKIKKQKNSLTIEKKLKNNARS